MSDRLDMTDEAADALVEATGGETGEVPGPSPNAATNLMIHDIILRSVSRLTRITAEKAILGKQYDKDTANAALSGRSAMSTLAAVGIARMATNSFPGAALVTTGLVVKTLFDRSQKRRLAVRKGNAKIRDMAKDGESN